MEISNIKPDIMQVVKEQMHISSAKAESAPAGEGASALPVNMPDVQSNVEALKNLLVSYGLTVNKENIDIMQKLPENGMPSDKESVLKLNQAMKLFNMLDISPNTADKAALNLEKALFALKNQLSITGETVYKMDGFLSESKSILSNMDIIMNELISAEKSPATDEILRIFTGEEGFSTSENAQLKPEISANILTEGSEAQPAIAAEGAASQTAQNAKTLPTDNLSQAQRQELL